MAGEGLFFTGTVLKNNRNLLKEEAVRQQLAMQQEELEMKKQAAVDARKKARRDGQKSLDVSLDTSTINPEYHNYINSETAKIQSFADENGQAIENGDTELRSQYQTMLREAKSKADALRNRSTQMTTYRNTANTGDVSTLAQDENGNSLYESTDSAFIESLGSGGDFYELNNQYNVATGMVTETDWIDPTIALFATEDGNREEGDLNNDGASWSYIPNQRKSENQKLITGKLTVNQGKWGDKDYGRIYKTKRVDVGGDLVNAQLAFFNEAYEDDNGNVGGNSNPGDHLLEMLDPSSENFNQQVSDDYAKYLGEKISNKGFENLKPIRTKSPSTDDESEEGVDLNKVQESLYKEVPLTNFNGVNIKSGSEHNQAIEVNVNTSIPIEALTEVDGQDIQSMSVFKELMDSGVNSVPVMITGFTVREDGQPLAILKYDDSLEVLVKIDRVKGIIQTDSNLKNNETINSWLDYSLIPKGEAQSNQAPR